MWFEEFSEGNQSNFVVPSLEKTLFLESWGDEEREVLEAYRVHIGSAVILAKTELCNNGA